VCVFVYISNFNFLMKFGNMSTSVSIGPFHHIMSPIKYMFLGHVFGKEHDTCFIEEEPLETRKMLTCMIM